MKIFLSYASEQKAIAEPIAFSLRSRGHSVFLDKDDLPAGRSYDDQIQKAVESSDVLVYLISPASVAQGRYTRTELEFARAAWRHPTDRVLPVLAEPTDLSLVPSFLKGVTILEPQGNVAAEVSAAVERLVAAAPADAFARNMGVLGALSGLATSLVAIATPISVSSEHPLNFGFGGLFVHNAKAAPFHVPLFFTAALMFGFARFGRLRIDRWLVLFAVMLVGWTVAVNVALQTGNAIGSAAYVDDSRITAETEEERQKIIETLNRSTSAAQSVNLLLGGFFAGAIGAASVMVGLAWSVGGVARRITGPLVLFVVVVGGVAGLALAPANTYTASFGDTFLPLLVVWQAAVGSAVAYVYANAKT